MLSGASIFHDSPIPANVKKLRSFVDTENGLEGFVYRRRDGKLVAVFCDTDAEQVIERRIYNDLEEAAAYAADLIADKPRSFSVNVWASV